MPRITRTENYYHDYGCKLNDCDRVYCEEHRLLWRECDTAYLATEGDRDVVNGVNTYYEIGDCPQCEGDQKKKEHYVRLCRQYPREAICPVCFKISHEADEIAIHLVDAHGWELENGTKWLRNKVEEGALNDAE